MLSTDRIYHPVGNICCMISDPLKIFGDHQDISRLLTHFGIFVNEIDNLHLDAVEAVIHLIVHVNDFRLISSALKMITDMERIGDQAADIAEITVSMAEVGGTIDLAPIQEMSAITMQMVEKSIYRHLNRTADQTSHLDHFIV